MANISLSAPVCRLFNSCPFRVSHLRGASFGLAAIHKPPRSPRQYYIRLAGGRAMWGPAIALTPPSQFTNWDTSNGTDLESNDLCIESVGSEQSVGTTWPLLRNTLWTAGEVCVLSLTSFNVVEETHRPILAWLSIYMGQRGKPPPLKPQA